MADSDNQPVRRVVPDSDKKTEQPKEPEETIIEEMPEGTDGNDTGGTGPTRVTIGSRISSWFESVGSTVSNGIGRLAGTFGIPKTAMSIILAVCLAGGGVGAATFISDNDTQNIILRQVDYEDDCADEYNDAVNKAPVSSDMDVDAQKEEVAEKLWAFGKTMGMTDEQCAGMLGNFERECGLDYTEIESVYEIWHNEKPYVMDPNESPNKWKLAQMPCTDMDKYVPGQMLASYSGSSTSVNLDGYKYKGDYADTYIDNSRYANHYYCGIGLVQWTGPTAAKLVYDAECLNEQGVTDSEGEIINWWNFEYQCAHMINSEQDGNGISRFQHFLNDTANSGSVDGATASWSGYMEAGKGKPYRGPDFNKRLTPAKQWYAKLSPQSSSITKKWSSWVNAVIELAETETGMATGKHAAELDEECDSDEKQQTFDNSDIARAGVAFAWKTKDQSHNNGTQVFKYVHDQIFPSDGWYKCCDTCVATAVRWSNADDSFPNHAVSDIEIYMKGSDLWDYVGMVGSVEYQPGDVLICSRAMSGGSTSHIILYASNEIIREKYPDDPASYEIVSGSKGTRSPGCGDSASYYSGYAVYRYNEAKGQYSGTSGSFEVPASLSATSD